MNDLAATAPAAGLSGKRAYKLPRNLGRRLGRSDRSQLAIWFWELDRVLLAMIMMLIAIGLIAVQAASPATARRLSTATETLSPLYFFYRQLGWVIVSLGFMFVVSMLPKREARRLAIIMACIFFVLLALVPIFGNAVNGSKRWIGYGIGIQPSEFLKPAYAVTMGWIISLRVKDPSLPVLKLSAAITACIAVLLMRQPDLGQTIMFIGIWFTLMLLAGLPMQVVGVGAGAVGMTLAYFFYPVATQRINGWLFGAGEYDHVMFAHKTLTGGGLIGTGPGLGVHKFNLPEAHTDYIFSVIGEEFGLLACAAIALVYFAIIVRICMRLLDERDLFTILAVTGLTAQLGGQAFINIAVNLQLFPSKGMTLPFISYGGSSMIALGIGAGLLLSLTRRNPFEDRSLLGSDWKN
ncbi:FtsW/RodA/SpoVE family cell cycle protein [Blastomonas sp.]|uniref:FtsW/RodA/SpoVE family cell cycle protein n=1 Tax=Blastomonas sp. TaxID=1909299 RepID=UPI00406A2B50